MIFGVDMIYLLNEKEKKNVDLESSNFSENYLEM